MRLFHTSIINYSIYIYIVRLVALISEVRPVSWAATRSSIDRMPKFEKARFPTSFRRAFPAKPLRSDASHHHQEVALVILYTVVLLFSQIRARFIDSPSFIPLFRREAKWRAPLSSFLATVTACAITAAPLVRDLGPSPAPSLARRCGRRPLPPCHAQVRAVPCRPCVPVVDPRPDAAPL
jgi:hypothetical protein